MQCVQCTAIPSMTCNQCFFPLCANHLDEFAKHMDINHAEALHLKILEARARKQYYYVDRDEFVEKTIRLDDDDVILLEDLPLIGTQRALYPLVLEYRRQRDALWARRIFFKGDLALQNCLNQWTPVKVLGQGAQGRVFQFCNGFRCGFAAKVEKVEQGNLAELQFYEIASKLNIAPHLEDHFVCENNQYLVIVTEMYETDMIELLFDNLLEPNHLDEIFSQIFSHIYRLYDEARVKQNDAKICNFVHKGYNNVKMVDYGIATFAAKDERTTAAENLLKHLNRVFMPSLVDPREWCLGYNGVFDPFNLRGPDETNFIRDSIIRVINRDLRFKDLVGRIDYVR